MKEMFRWFHYAYDAFFCRDIPFSIRWRLLLMQPISFLTYIWKTIPWLYSRDVSTFLVPARSKGRYIRTLVFQPLQASKVLDDKRPIHLDVHGGAWIGGVAEYDAAFCSQLTRATGAVVISAQYRTAPGNIFPAAHEDVEDVLRFIIENARKLWMANPELLTVSGFSAGGNMVLAASQMAEIQMPNPHAVKGCVTFYAPVDLRKPPWEKPVPLGLQGKDAGALLGPILDCYVGPQRARSLDSPTLNPILAPLETLPPDMLFIIPDTDIISDEQIHFVERLQRDRQSHLERDSDKHIPRRIESIIFKGQFHGWLELPSFAIEESTRKDAFSAAISFLKEIHQTFGWNFSAQGGS